MDTIAAYRRSRPRFSDVAPTATDLQPSAALRQFPHSTASLGPAFRSRSLDHRRFSNFDTEEGGGGVSRTYYASKPGAGGGRAYAAPPSSQYKGELFGGGGNKKGTMPQLQPKLAQSNSDAYRRSSVERAGVTVVPILRESTLPTRRSEWRNFEWKSRSPTISRPPLEDSKKECEEYTNFDRAIRYNHQRTVWPPPNRGALGYGRRLNRMEVAGEPRRVGSNVYYPDSATAEYSSRRSHQTGSDAAHREHLHNGHQQRHHRSYREWHSGVGAREENGHYGAYDARRSDMEQRQQYGRDREGMTGYHRQFREAKDLRRTTGEDSSRHHEYANGWGGGAAHQYTERGYGGHFEDDRTKGRWTSSHGMPKDYDDSSKRYRKIRCCCFNLIWPPWAIVPSEPPKPMYGNGTTTEQQQRTYERNVPIELRTFDGRREPFERDGAAGQMPSFNGRMSSPIGRNEDNLRNANHFQGLGPGQEETGAARTRHPAEESPAEKWGRRERRETDLHG